jgi:hypothetical protein
MSFERIYSYIISRVPFLGANAKNPSIITEWLASGYDTDKDIIPAVDFVCKRGVNTIKGFGWFTGAIRWQHQKRIEAQYKPKEKTQAEADAIRANNIRWHKDRGITSTKVGPQDFAWLEQYERKKENGLMNG